MQHQHEFKSLHDDQVHYSRASFVQSAVCLFLAISVSRSSTCHSSLRQPLCCEIKTYCAPPFREHPNAKLLVYTLPPPQKKKNV